MPLKKPLAALALCAFSAALAARPFPIPKPHYKALCVVDSKSRVHCARLEDLNRLLSPEQVAELQQLIDDLFPQLARKKARNTLVSCGHGDWIKTDLTVPPSTAAPQRGVLGPGKPPPLFPSIAQGQSLVSQCRTSVQNDFDRAVSAAGGSRSQFVADTVAQMDAAAANCQESSSPVAMATPASRWVDAKTRYDTAAQAVEAKFKPPENIADWSSEGIWAYAVWNTSDTIKAGLEKAFTYAYLKYAEDHDFINLEQTQNLIVEILNSLAQGLEDLFKKSQPPRPPDPPLGPPPAPAVTKAPIDVTTLCFGEDCKPSCSELEKRWNMFKASCEMSGWQAFSCQAFLAAANHCVDPRLINPGPDGDMTCPSRARLDKWGRAKLAWVAQCKKRKWIMTPTDRGEYLCVAPNFGAVPPRFDPCNDPRVLTSPDQCGGPNPGNAPKPPRPVPQPDPHRPG